MQTPASSTAFVETLSFDDPTLANALFGPHNAHLNVIAERTGADLSTRGTTLAVTSDDPALRERILNLFTQFYGLLRSGHALQSSDLEQGLQLLESDPGSDLRRSFRDEAVLSLPKKTVTARNAAQRAYLETLRSNEMVFSVGPAGTGKTYLAVAAAVAAFRDKRVSRIILTRPAVGARSSASFPAISPKRSTRICALFTMPCLTCSGPRRWPRFRKRALSKSRRWPSCAAGP